MGLMWFSLHCVYLSYIALRILFHGGPRCGSDFKCFHYCSVVDQWWNVCICTLWHPLSFVSTSRGGRARRRRNWARHRERRGLSLWIVKPKYSEWMGLSILPHLRPNIPRSGDRSRAPVQCRELFPILHFQNAIFWECEIEVFIESEKWMKLKKW